MWTPLFADAHYGILPLVAGTLTTTMVALLVAIPLGTIIAIYLSEFAPHHVRETVKPMLELLGAVPTVVYGYFALTDGHAGPAEAHARACRASTC